MQLRDLSNLGQRLTYLYYKIPVIINCALGSDAMPYFEVNIANASFSQASRFVMSQGERELHNHGLFLIQRPTSDSPLAVVEINNTNINNGTINNEMHILWKSRI